MGSVFARPLFRSWGMMFIRVTDWFSALWQYYGNLDPLLMLALQGLRAFETFFYVMAVQISKHNKIEDLLKSAERLMYIPKMVLDEGSRKKQFT